MTGAMAHGQIGKAGTSALGHGRRALVIGGSLGGLFVGNLLQRAGWDVQIYERVAEELEARGAGIVTHPELMAALEEAGVPADESLGVRVDDRVTLDRQGDRQASLTLPQTFAAWSRLYRVLRAAFPDERYHNGRQFASFNQDVDGVTVTMADGEEVRCDLLVAADGARSGVRQQLLPSAQPQYAGYVAWRGLVEEAVLSKAVLSDLFPYFGFGLPPHEQMVAYPVAGAGNDTGPGKRRYNFVWYRPAAADGGLIDLLTDASGKVWRDGIPPPLLRPEVLADVRRAARDILAPQFAEVVEKTEGLFFQPIFDLESERLAFGRAVLIGDAAFVARPHCGMGVTKAAGDAVQLARCLAGQGDVAAALKAYEAPRLAVGRRIVRHARDLGAYMQAQLRDPREREMAERFRAPLSVMRETAVPLEELPAKQGTSGPPARGGVPNDRPVSSGQPG